MNFLYILLDTLMYGIPYALLALGIFISYRVLDIADLSAEGTFTLGGAITAVLLVLGFNAWLATFFGMISGFLAGLFTGFLHAKLKITGLLAGIITMTALFSINMVIMGIAPTTILNTEKGIEVVKNSSGFSSVVYLTGINTSGEQIKTVFESFFSFFNNNNINIIFVSLIIVIFVIGIIYWFFGTNYGMDIRATGINQKMARAQGINTSLMIILGLGIGNSLIALSGSLFIQTQGSCSSTMGVGTLVLGLASIIIGETIFGKKSFKNWLVSVALGSICYYFIIVIVVNIGLPSQYRKALYAILMLIVLVFSFLKERTKNKKGGLVNASA